MIILHYISVSSLFMSSSAILAPFLSLVCLPSQWQFQFLFYCFLEAFLIHSFIPFLLFMSALSLHHFIFLHEAKLNFTTSLMVSVPFLRYHLWPQLKFPLVCPQQVIKLLSIRKGTYRRLVSDIDHPLISSSYFFRTFFWYRSTNCTAFKFPIRIHFNDPLLVVHSSVSSRSSSY